MPLFYHKYVNYVLAHSVNYVITLYRLAPPVAPNIAIPTTIAKPHYPSKSTISLPPLSKGGGLTAQHKLLLCCFLLVIRLPFQFIKLFCRQDGGIALYPPTSPFPQPLQKDNNPSLSTTSLPPLEKGEVA